MCRHLQEELGGMSYVTAIGLGAAFCTTIAFLPQAIKTWRTRSTKDIFTGDAPDFLNRDRAVANLRIAAARHPADCR
jgi:hypothetical protein